MTDARRYLPLRGWPDGDLAHIHFGRLFDGERNGTGNRIRRDGHFVPGAERLRSEVRIGHGIGKVGVNKSRRYPGHAQSLPRFLAQSLGDGAHGVLGRGVNTLQRDDLESRRRNDIDEMTEPLAAKHRQRRRDSIQNAFQIHIDHGIPVLDAQIVEKRKGSDPRVADEYI
jgi:hypothetical protein